MLNKVNYFDMTTPEIIGAQQEYHSGKIHLYQMDCMECMATLPYGSIDLVITDPPYSTPIITSFGRKRFRNLADLSMQEFYFIEMKKRLELILKPDAPVFFFCDDKFYPILWGVFYDWTNSGLIIWDKGRIGMGRPIRKRHELIFYANRGSRDFIPHGEYTHLPSVLNIKHDKDKIHGAQKPLDLIEMLIRGFSGEGDTIADFFAGSSTTGIASINTNRNFIGIELDKEIFEAAKKRLDIHKMQTKLF